MKAMILAAGLGTRLRPYSNEIPKPLFVVAGRPLLDLAIENLMRAGCEAIIINTHHLHAQIEDFVGSRHYPIPILTRFEPAIRGTGGAIKNVADFWDERPFMVVNGDIVSTIDLKVVYDFHCRHLAPVTLVLYDDPHINSVSVDHDGTVCHFGELRARPSRTGHAQLTFTGIQVLDPQILDFIPADRPSSSIDAFRKLMAAGRKIQAFVARDAVWNDIGSPARYQKTAIDLAAPEAFRRAYPHLRPGTVTHTRLKGDGSQRRWYRLHSDHRTIIMVNHGIQTGRQTAEIDSFVKIGNHLYACGIPVPKIYWHDRFAGLVFLEDVGDTDLQTATVLTKNLETTVDRYQRVIDALVNLSQNAARGFDPLWSYQSPRYDSELILEKECRYFLEAFLKGYLGWELSSDAFGDEFCTLAHRALQYPTMGLMHRDLQSRNIMLKDNHIYFIDFQGSRFGPLQYDLASLLIDPYVALPVAIQSRLLSYCIAALSSRIDVDPDQFRHCFTYCCLTRNLQILGAFGYLSVVMKKKYFTAYIPAAVQSLHRHLAGEATAAFPGLTSLVENIWRRMRNDFNTALPS